MLKLNLGSGPHALKGWVNYDYANYPGVLQLDLSKGHLPHVNSSVNYIMTEHMIEHLTKQQAVSLLHECHRVLKPSGVIRIVMPDLSRLLGAYTAGELCRLPGVWEPGSTCDMVNEGMRLWGHQYLWDKAELSRVLMSIGFKSAWDCRRHISVHEELCGLEVRPEHFEMYVEARKETVGLQ